MQTLKLSLTSQLTIINLVVILYNNLFLHDLSLALFLNLTV